MCDKMDLMVLRICGLCLAVLTVLSNYTDNRIDEKKVGIIPLDVLRAGRLEYFQLLMHTALSIVTLTE